MKTKDFIFGVLFFTIYMAISMPLSMTLGIASYIVGVPVLGVISAIVPLLLMNKVPKFGVITLFTAVYTIITTLMGPMIIWIITVMLCALIADIIAKSARYENTLLLGFAFGVMLLGHSLGYVITAVFFFGMYEENFINRMGAEWVQSFKSLFQNPLTLSSFFILPPTSGIVGMFLAKKIFKKHFKKEKK